jgi:hypothetical protein
MDLVPSEAGDLIHSVTRISRRRSPQASQPWSARLLSDPRGELEAIERAAIELR